MKKLICLLVICANLVGVAVNVSAYSDYDTEETRFLRSYGHYERLRGRNI